MKFNEREAITDSRLLKQSLTVIVLVIAGFMLQRQIGIEPATIAVFGAAVLLALDNLGKDPEQQSHNVHAALSEAEWITLMFFLGLFVLVYGVEKAGLIHIMAQGLIDFTQGNFPLATVLILWSSAIVSAFIDNIPFVATMIPLIKNLAPAFGGEQAIMPLWWALSLGACLGGNGTLIGASANLVVAGLAERAGTHFRFLEYLKIAFPLMLISIVISHAYIVWRYL
jgi:Na+/H+ antiporter NhaD/arsenite permease-like protein